MIDRDGPIPVYRQVADVVAERIRRGELLPHRPIPSESQLVAEFEIARETARRAVSELRERGLVYTVPQRGTFVGREPPGSG